MRLKVFKVRLDGEHAVADEVAANAFHESADIVEARSTFQDGSEPCWAVLVFYENGAKAPAPREPEPELELAPDEEALYEALRARRRELAIKEGVAQYIVATNASLRLVAKARPSSGEELLALKGFSEARVAKYGADILAVVSGHSPAPPVSTGTDGSS